MSDVAARCDVCRGLLDEEDLCANCGTEVPVRSDVESDASEQVQQSFTCGGCGASMNYDAAAQTLRCPFCGSEQLREESNVTVLAPRRTVPFRMDREQARQTLRQALGRGFWRPSDLSQVAAITKIAPVYVPFWVFRARTSTFWTADTNVLPPGARGDWRPVSGEHHGEYEGLLVGASSVLTPRESWLLSPFDLDEAVPAGQEDRSGCIIEQFRVQRKYARPLAREGLETLERQACARYVPGRARNVKVNVRLEGLSSEPVLLPVWVLAYRYRDRVHRFLINGQTGRAIGKVPVSRMKIVGATALAVLLALLILLAMVLLGFWG